MKNKNRFYILLGLVGAFWFSGCCTYSGGMVAVYSKPPRKPAPHAPAIHHGPAPHHQQAFLPPSFRHGPGGHYR